MTSPSPLPKVLFILKKRTIPWTDTEQETYSNGGGSHFSSGLWNSARLAYDMLVKTGFEAKMVEVFDADFIDREVHDYEPDVVIIEAYFVTPAKFRELRPLHPRVKWIVRNHSELAFLANEGIGMEWSKEYSQIDNVFVSCNSDRAHRDFASFIDGRKLVYLPNYYPVEEPSVIAIVKEAFFQTKKPAKDFVRIACPGAIRPLKNQLSQAVAAIVAARKLDKHLYFHINGTRVENAGASVLKSIRGLFAANPNATLVEEGWRNHTQFLDFLRQMDVVMQVSYTETFCIVAADAVSVGTPVVASAEVRFSDPALQAKPDCVLSMTKKLETAIRSPRPLMAKFLLWKTVKPVPGTWRRALVRTSGL